MRETAKRLRALCAIAAASLCMAAPAALADDPVEKDGFGIAAFDGMVSAGPIPDEIPGPLGYQLPNLADPADPANFPAAFTQAGGHPYEVATVFSFNRYTHPSLGPNWPEEPPKDIIVDAPPGLLGNPEGIPQCTLDELAVGVCPVGSQVGSATVIGDSPQLLWTAGIFLMEPPTGVPARFAFALFGTIINIDAELRSEGDYGLSFVSRNTSEGIPLNEVRLAFWGTPADPSHQLYRHCPDNYMGIILGEPGCPSDQPERPFISLPTACTAPGQGLKTTMRADSWFHPGEFKEASFLSHRPPGWIGSPSWVFVEPPVEPALWGPPQGPTGCEELLFQRPFEPDLALQPSADAVETPTGLSVEVAMPEDLGLEDSDFLARPQVKKAVVTLPEGVTINPAAAEGLGSCTPAQLDAETYSSPLGAGCPADSRIGSVAVKSPLVEGPVEGSLFIARQDDPRTGAGGAENPFDSDLAMYVVAKEPTRGIVVKLAGKVEADPRTGQILTTFDDLPQLPFSTFELRFREGQRAVLVSPPACGTYETKAEFVPWAAKDPDNPTPAEIHTTTSAFQIGKGVEGGPCPSGGVPPFNPGYVAGSINNNAGSYSPFSLRLTRKDGDQDMTKFSATLPPGVLGKLAGVSKCPDASIAAAAAKTGREELASPSCPAGSQIGAVLAGAGVGSALTYIPGKVYLGGPYNGDPLSVVAITPAVSGPFDVGTVVVREALTLNPESAEVEVDGAASDPIPHILKGIPLKVRDIRIYIDRERFILNPTDCTASAAKATLFGGFLDVFSSADDVPVDLSSRYQAANCASLGFKPRLALRLSGGTRRGGHPALRAVLRAREGDANIGAATVTLPKSAFLDQSHIRTICTRVQFAAKNCPQGAQYGYARAFTPLLEEPIQGPVYLRSSNHKLPDLVAALHGLVDVNIVGRIDSHKGGIRSSFESVPDAPVSKFVLTMQGGKKGLVVNSRNLCAAKNRASVRFTGQNGKRFNLKPTMKASCKKGRRGKR